MQTIRLSTYEEFWPTGWMVWLCVALAVFDASLIGFIVRQLFAHIGSSR